MSTDNYYNLTIGGFNIDVVRKDIKNLHIGVYPPNGQVRIASPLNMTEDNIRLAVISKLSWIKKQQKKFIEQLRQSKREMISGETHYFLGRSYRLKIIEFAGKPEIELKQNELRLYIPLDLDVESRKKILYQWYRNELKKLIPGIVEKWEKKIPVHVSDWKIRKMKTKWGSCNIENQSLLLNLELIKKSQECIEYIIVHEMIHLLERHHNENFKGLMTQYFPNWQIIRKVLNESALGHEEWKF